MKKKILVMIMAVLMLLSSFALTGCGKDTQDATSDLQYVQDKGKLVVGITDFAPMDYKDKNGNWIGFDADLAKAFADSIGVEIEFIEIDWNSKEMELENKTIDCVWNGMTLTDGVMKAMETSNPYCNNAQVVVVKKDKAAGIKSVEDCKDLAFAVEAGSAGEDLALANKFDTTGLSAQSDAIMEVAAGTAEACVIDSLMAGAMVGEGTSYPNLVTTIALNEELYGVGFRKGSDLAKTLNDFFVKTYGDGKMMEIAKKYGTQESVIEQK